MASNASPEEVIRKLKLVVARNGIATVKQITSNLHNFEREMKKQNPSSETGVVFNEEFTNALMKGGLFLSKHESSTLLRSYKKDDLTVDYRPFLDQIQAPMTGARLAVVNELWNGLIDKKQDSSDIKSDSPQFIEYSVLFDTFDPSAHPGVVMGLLSIGKAEQLLKDAFQIEEPGSSKSTVISKDTFISDFRGISAAYPHNSESFIDFVRNSWHSVLLLSTEQTSIKDQTDPEELQEYFDQLSSVFREKIDQKTTGTINHSMTLIKFFKHFDTDNDGFVDFRQFQSTLEAFGLLVPPDILLSYYQSFQGYISKNERMDYRVLSKEIFPEE